MAGTTKYRDDLRRYAVCDAVTGEVFDVGMNAAEANSYVASYNQAMARSGRQCCRVQIAWELVEEIGSKVRAAGVEHLN